MSASDENKKKTPKLTTTRRVLAVRGEQFRAAAADRREYIYDAARSSVAARDFGHRGRQHHRVMDTAITIRTEDRFDDLQQYDHEDLNYCR